ncbi:hypothetical protein [Serratia proteamaculans]|uniref:hypothetical protein n=1 Tax=Serratia proteamaculans TaxID=28151 RepID=UPI003CFC46AB
MWWKLTLVVIVMMGLFLVLGLYAGGWMFLLLTSGSLDDVTYRTLYDASTYALDDHRLVFLPWSWCVTAALTFLPVGLTLLALFAGFKPKRSLHGNARFANAQELRAFEYVGEYKEL